MPWKELDEPTAEEGRQLDLRHRGKARFLVDESVGINVAKILQGYGYNAKYVADMDLCGRSDEDVFAAARKDNRVLVTHDADFFGQQPISAAQKSGGHLGSPWFRRP